MDAIVVRHILGLDVVRASRRGGRLVASSRMDHERSFRPQLDVAGSNRALVGVASSRALWPTAAVTTHMPASAQPPVL